MVSAVQSVANAALQLSPEDREALVEQLLASLESDGGLHPAWHEEIARRLAALQAGNCGYMPADEAMSRLTQHIHDRRPAT